MDMATNSTFGEDSSNLVDCAVSNVLHCPQASGEELPRPVALDALDLSQLYQLRHHTQLYPFLHTTPS